MSFGVFLKDRKGLDLFHFSFDFSLYLFKCTSFVFVTLLEALPSMFSCFYVSLGVLLVGGPGMYSVGYVALLDQDRGDTGGHVLSQEEKAARGAFGSEDHL